jgi:transcriptional regulator with XRE-family HTH domain
MPVRHETLSRFGRNVRRRREAVGLLQEALAEKANLDRTYVSGIKRGVRNPTVLSAALVAAALRIPLAELFSLPVSVTPVRSPSAF